MFTLARLTPQTRFSRVGRVIAPTSFHGRGVESNGWVAYLPRSGRWGSDLTATSEPSDLGTRFDEAEPRPPADRPVGVSPYGRQGGLACERAVVWRRRQRACLSSSLSPSSQPDFSFSRRCLASLSIFSLETGSEPTSRTDPNIDATFPLSSYKAA